MDHKEIEKVQKMATKLAKSISHLPYGERLKKLSLTTLLYNITSENLKKCEMVICLVFVWHLLYINHIPIEHYYDFYLK